MGSAGSIAATSPVTDGDGDGRGPEPGVALCLSGGGYRAMVFHVGVLWRLNELGWLSALDRVSSVSGGSITAGVLGLHWFRLGFEDGIATGFEEQVVEPVRALAGHTVDAGSVLGGMLRPGRSVTESVAGAYRKHLFGNATLQELPDEPRFVINATNVGTGSLWRFSKPYMADHRIGLYPEPDVELAQAVAASSAFPPMLSPMRMALDPGRLSPEGRGPLAHPPYTSQVALSDGGVYDNLGLETAWKRCETILVSDGGGQMAPEPEVRGDWPRHAVRINAVIDNQVRSLRKRQIIAGFEQGDRRGAYWGIRSDIAGYAVPGGGLACPVVRTRALAAMPTRLRKMPGALQERLINWGYAICDAAMRTHVVPAAAPPPRFPYPAQEVG